MVIQAISPFSDKPPFPREPWPISTPSRVYAFIKGNEGNQPHLAKKSQIPSHGFLIDANFPR
jgi:hypothetical protein